MINLLNPADLRQIRAARVNVRLRRYAIATLLTLIAVGGVYGIGYKLAADEYATAKTKHSESQQELKQYDAIKKEADAYRSDLGIAKKIFSNETVFSNFMVKTAKILPPNTILDGLTLTTKPAVGVAKKPGSAQIKARAKSYADVLALKTSLETSEIFSDVRISSTTVPNETKDLPIVERTYPYQVSFDLVINQKKAAE